MKHVLFNTICIASITLFSGCVGVSVTKIENNGPDAIRVSSSIPGVQKKTTPGLFDLTTTSDLLRLKIQVTGKNNEGKILVDELKPGLAGDLAQSSAKIVTEKSDLILIVTPQITLLDQSGDYYRMSCTIPVEIKSNNRTYASKRFVFPATRKLGKEETIKQFAEPAVAAIASWAKKELKRINAEEVCSEYVLISLTEKQTKENEAVAVNDIGNKLKKMSGILSWEYIGKTKKGLCCFRVSYIKSAYPVGIKTTLLAEKTK